MNKSLQHLPQHKQEEIKALAKIIRMADLNMLKLVLFGSYARGNYVEEFGVDEDGSYEYTSDYDFLIVVEKTKNLYRFEQWRKMEKELDKYPTRCPINIIRHTIKEVNALLSQGHYFFSDIVKEGILLYDRGEPLAEPKILTREEQLEVMATHFAHWFERALLFERTYLFLMKSGDLRTAAFTLHQVTESLFATLLLVKTGYKPRSHDLTSLEKRAAHEIEEFEEVFPKETEEQRELFDLLCRAYIESRYHKKFQVTKDQLKWLEKPVLQLKQITGDLCRQAGVVTELLDSAPPEEPTEEFMAELEKSWEDSGRKELALKTIRRYRDEGFELGEQEGFNRGEQSGIEKGKAEGYQLGEEAGLEKGKEEGYQLGEQDGVLKVAKAMKEKGADSQFIAETTGLSPEIIKTL